MNQTEIAALRLEIAKACENWIPEIKIHPKLLEKLLKALEAERQRADEVRKTCDMYRDKFILAEAENTALKGDQAPVQFRWRWRSNSASAWTYQDMKHYSRMVDADKSSGNNIEFEQPFTAPQKLVIIAPNRKDKFWTAANAGFVAKCDNEWKAAIEAAGGTVKNGE